MDTKITDKGWAAMRELLDREMPEKRRRRFGWWWLALLLLPIAGYGSWHWLKSPDGGKQKPTDTPAQAIASVAPSVEKASNFSQEKQVGTVIALNASATTGGQQSGKAKSIETIKPSNIEYAPMPCVDDLTLEDDLSIEIYQMKKEAAKTLAASQILSPNYPQPILFQITNTASPKPVAAADIAKPVKKEGGKHWAFGASSAISTEQFSTINGFSTGLNVDWKFARKWGLRTGAFYNIHRPQVKHRPVASVATDAYESNVYGDVIVVDVTTGHEVTNPSSNNFYGDSLGNNVFIPVSRLQRIEIPVTVFWQPAQPLKIFGGVSLSRTLSTKADRQNYSGDYILKLANRTAEDGASKLSSTELDNWSADAMLGAGLQVGKIFEVGLSAKMPFSKFFGFSKEELDSHLMNPSSNMNESLGTTRKQSGPVFSLYGTLFF